MLETIDADGHVQEPTEAIADRLPAGMRDFAPRQAIDASGLVLHYQPIVRLQDETVVAAEALVRMRGTDGTLMLPSSFVPQAEATGLVVPMGAWVMRRAMADLRKWQRAYQAAAQTITVADTLFQTLLAATQR